MNNQTVNISISNTADCRAPENNPSSDCPGKANTRVEGNAGFNSDSDCKKMTQEFESQLHEQYAINNNANVGSGLSLIIAILAVFAGYGYIYLHSCLEFSDCFKVLYNDRTALYYLDALLLTAGVVYLALGIVYYVCMTRGTAQRMEQFITYAIRYKYFPELRNRHLISSNQFDKIFPEEYHPFDKDDLSNIKNKCCLCALCENHKKITHIAQGIYSDILPLVSSLYVLLTISIVVKLLGNILNYHGNGLSWYNLTIVVIMAIICSIFQWLIVCKRKELINKYRKRVEEYKTIKP